MTTEATGTPTGNRAERDPSLLLGLGATGLALAGLSTYLGAAWDIMWHQDVGPDTFFTAPHLLVYAGAAGAGLASLAVVLGLTWRARSGAAPDGVSVPLLRGAFRGPVGFAIAGWGAVIYLLAGLYDQGWHAVYDFDAALTSPPHTALGLADLIVITGVVVVFSMLATHHTSHRRPSRPSRPSRPAEFGLYFVTALFMLGTASYQIGFLGEIALGMDGSIPFIAFVHAAVLLAVSSVTRRPGAATATAVLFTALMAIGWVFSVQATQAYADALGLFPRDNAVGLPEIIAVLPKFTIPAALVIDLALGLGRGRAASVRTTVLLAGASGMVVLAAFEVLIPTVLGPPTTLGLIMSLGWAGVLGAFGGWVGWKSGVLLRRLPGAVDHTPAPAPAARTAAA